MLVPFLVFCLEIYGLIIENYHILSVRYQVKMCLLFCSELLSKNNDYKEFQL